MATRGGLPEEPECGGTSSQATLITPRGGARLSGTSVDNGATKLRVFADISAGARSPDVLVKDDGPESLKGSTLSGRYRLDALLGQGGMGVVFRATDLQMPGVEVAIKLLLPEFRAQPELLNILRESVRKVRALPHPNIASVYSLDSDGQNDFVIMELLQGQTLQTLLDGEYARGLPIAMARTLIADLCSALAYAHDHSVIHSDIKPSNIFVTASGRAKLFDFDIARVLRGPVGYFDASRVGAITRAYCSTEMARGDRPDPRDDVYALACVIYEMLSGVHPFDGATAWEAHERGLQVKPLPALRHKENRALIQALKFAREERLPSVEALQSAFANRGGALTWVRLKPLPLAAAAAGVVLATALGWWLVRSSAAPHPVEMDSRAAAELEHARSLAAQAGQLAVDDHDETYRRAISLLSSVHDGDGADFRSRQAQLANAALTSALAHAPRIARVGTTEKQLLEALALCQQLPGHTQHCTARELADEAPRSVSLQPFEVDPAPVTNAEFARFVEETGRRTLAESAGLLYSPDPTRGWNIALRGQNWRTLREEAAARGGASADSAPVLGMDLESARAYCNWKGKRLPSEEEWEYHARGPSGRVFPWGDQSEPGLASLSTTPGARGDRSGGVAQVASGRVAEWTETRTPSQHILRGGSWLLPEPYFQRLALRRQAPPGAALDASFRCAASVASWPGFADGGATVVTP